jgi:hypothetical protein
MIIGLLLALLFPAVQSAREAARKTECANHLHQTAIACHLYHDVNQVLPSGLTLDTPAQPRPYMTWLNAILPYIEMNALATQRDAWYAAERMPFDQVSHPGTALVIPTYTCPSDDRVHMPQETYEGYVRGLTSYLGVSGTDLHAKDGLLFGGSNFPMTAITDGISNTLLIGERPPSPDFWYGWWYSGYGQLATGSVDMVLGVREINVGWRYLWFCDEGPWHFQPGDLERECHALHFWSMHPQGAYFARGDASIHFMNYAADSVLPGLATRFGGD